MQTYLCFTRREFQAIVRVCRAVELTEESFPALKPFLVDALRNTMPELSERIAELRKYQIGIIYKYLKERREAAARRTSGSERLLSREELQALSDAFQGIQLQDRFLSYSRDLLVLHFREASPPLAAKLTRLSDGQFEKLCDQVRGWK